VAARNSGGRQTSPKKKDAAPKKAAEVIGNAQSLQERYSPRACFGAPANAKGLRIRSRRAGLTRA